MHAKRLLHVLSRFPRSPRATSATTYQHKDSTADALLTLIAHSARATHAVVDQQYTVTAVMIERSWRDGQSQHLLVELLHEPGAASDQSWMAMATNNLYHLQVGPYYGAAAHQVIDAISWGALDPAFARFPDELPAIPPVGAAAAARSPQASFTPPIR